MTKLSLLLLCAVTILLSWPTVADDSQPAPNFDKDQLFNVTWYEQFFSIKFNASAPPAPLSLCTIEIITPLANGSFFHQIAFTHLSIPQEFLSATQLLTQNPNNTWKFVDADASAGKNLAILDFSPTYDWIIFYSDQFVGYIGLAVKSLDYNLTEITRAVELSNYYGLDIQSLNLQGAQCNYTFAQEQLACQRVI